MNLNEARENWNWNSLSIEGTKIKPFLDFVKMSKIRSMIDGYNSVINS